MFNSVVVVLWSWIVSVGQVRQMGVSAGRREVPSRLLTVDEIAEWLQIPKNTLYRQNSNGVPPGSLGVRVGRWLRYDPSVVQRWLDEGGSR